MGEPAVNGEVQCWKCSMTVGSSFASCLPRMEKFTIGQISSVKTDSDGVVRKVTVKNKLNQPKNTGVNYSESPYKYAERNVRGLALLITAQEKRDTECVDTDLLRTSPWLYNKDHTEEYNDEENVIDDESHEENVNENQESNFIENNVESEEDITELEAEENTAENVNRNELQIISPTSTRRKRWKPKRLDL